MAHRLSFLLMLTVFLPFTFSSAFRWRCPAEDQQIVVEIFAELNMTLSTDCCRIYNMISCNPNTSRVMQFELNFYDFNGRLPEAIGKLTNIGFLSIHKMPGLQGGIPPSFANLVNLRYFRITWTGLSGPIPTWLNQLTKLDGLDLSFNKFSGSIPPNLADLPKLSWLRLDRNQLTGPIPESFGRLQAAEIQIFLSHNNLSGTIPKSLGHANLSYIDLDRNQLAGDPSHLFNGRSKPLNTIILSRNLFNFDLSNAVFPLGLQILDFSHNMIHGSIPADITGLANLHQFNVSYNRLCGRIPQGGSMQQFDSSSYMHNECLCGPPLSAKC